MPWADTRFHNAFTAECKRIDLRILDGSGSEMDIGIPKRTLLLGADKIQLAKVIRFSFKPSGIPLSYRSTGLVYFEKSRCIAIKKLFTDRLRKVVATAELHHIFIKRTARVCVTHDTVNSI